MSCDCSEKVGLNTMANEATFRLIDEALTRGVNLTAVRRPGTNNLVHGKLHTHYRL